MKRTARIGTGLAAGSVAVVAAATIAMASPTITSSATADDTTPDTTTSAPAEPRDGMGRHGRGGAGETLLTGSDADKATEAALAKYPDATILRVETDTDGTYEAHIITTDGTHVDVKMDESFQITATEEHAEGMRGGRGQGGERGGPGAGETLLTGDEADKATAAAEKAVPDGTVLRVETDADGTYEAHVTTPDGTHVDVKMDENFKVTSKEEHTAGMRGGHGPGGGHRGGPGADAENGASDDPSAAASSAA